MLSVIVYGRNDQHGVNLQRRAALSLNALAHVLGEDDELVFVDVRTPDGLATFPEAIDDLLTEAALARLRVIRVREADLAGKHLDANQLPEGLARNVGARRARNPWFLFTTTDVLLVEPRANALREALSAATAQFYQAPRRELPQYLWEMLPRSEPHFGLAFLLEHGERLSLAQRVLGEDTVLFDNPGDFQLVARSAFEAIDGFDEGMTKPFHVDANLAVRLRLGLGEIAEFDAVSVVHCDHARAVTRMNDREAPANDYRRYVQDVCEAELLAQRQSWGLAARELEEVRLSPPAARLAAYLERLPPAPSRVLESRYCSAAFNSLAYDPEAVSHFIVDRLCTLAPGATIGWAGADPRLLAATSVRLRALGRALEPPLVCGPLAQGELPWGRAASVARVLEEAQLLVVAFGGEGVAHFRAFDRPPARFSPSASELAQLDIAGVLRAAAAVRKPEPVVLVNAINNEFERMARQLVRGPLAPFATRLRDGRLRSEDAWAVRLSDLALATGASRRDDGIAAPEGHRGDIVEGGPYLDLAPALYRASMTYTLAKPGLSLLRLKFDLMAFGEEIASTAALAAHGRGEISFDFEVAPAFLARRGVAPFEIRISGNGRAACLIESVRFERRSAVSLTPDELALAHRGQGAA